MHPHTGTAFLAWIRLPDLREWTNPHPPASRTYSYFLPRLEFVPARPENRLELCTVIYELLQGYLFFKVTSLPLP